MKKLGRNFFNSFFDCAKGIDIIICDHHLPDIKVPKAYAVLNPKQSDCAYPFKDLCGCGIAYKLITAHNLKSENKLNIVETNLGIPNTFVWSPDNTKFYFTDTTEGSLLEYNFNLDEGSLSDKKNFFDFDRGAPDGSTIDSDGFIWNCRWGGSCVVKIDPKGRVDQIYQLPVENVTNCVFGGSDLKTLFITTANNLGKNKYDGSLFALNVNTPGIEDNKFKI